ncbi:lipoprotein, putative [Lentisphaera araneosa HTCC2155]|uniref:Lipoprotein, putative n=1 Tax=Lentisphaera araneosa HTCC2155 TaxID=313628 RepID=A6DUA5_9BACT|nr:lipoprotein, putative [Lentisphaera araneosa HTCC2155]
MVMGHEVAHAVAEHGNERMSHSMLIKGGILATSIGLKLSDSVDDDLGNAILIGAGAFASVGIILPYSRAHELEADYMGLVFMAKAGYNPERAITFWQDMSKASKGGKPPEFLSTHPADTRRIDEIKKYLPKAMYYYRQTPQYEELEREKLIPKF